MSQKSRKPCRALKAFSAHVRTCTAPRSSKSHAVAAAAGRAEYKRGVLGVGVLFVVLAQGPAFFDPPPSEARLRLTATRRAQPPVLDGTLDDWPAAPTVDGGFVQFEPQQGAPASRHTAVWLAYDEQHLYVAARLSQPEPVNQRDLRRDFSWTEADSFGVALDPFGDGRTALVFQVNPYGAQRDFQVLDDEVSELNWDTLWRCATRRDAQGWTVELALPFRSFRFGPGPWGVQLIRRQRGINEDSSLVAVPRSVSLWRMTYAAALDGLELPPPRSFDLQLRPYLVARAQRVGDAPWSVLPSGGGEVTWAPSKSTVVDLTGNTDFAETDVDRRVVNLSRFSVLFPERRQFFLESAGVFTVAGDSGLQPFFSRRVGLVNGVPGVVYGGARAVYRSTERSFGALVVATAPNDAARASVVGVARYAHNLGATGRVGGLVTFRHDFERPGDAASTNLVPVVDAFTRLGSVTLSGSGMGSFTREATGDTFGAAGSAKLAFQSNTFSFQLRGFGLTPRFDARAGFVSRANVFGASLDAGFDLRPAWLPRFLRNTGPWLEAYTLWSSDRARFQEANLLLAPVWIQFKGGDEAWLFVEGTAQVLDEPFQPLRALTVPDGTYLYGRGGLSFFTQASRPVAFGVDASLGRYYVFDELRTNARLSLQPIPHLQLAATYGFNHFWGAGLSAAGVDAHLLLLETRLAVSPKLQLIGSFQRDSAGNRLVTNARLAWEYLPLSFVYLVLTDTRAAYASLEPVVPETRVVLKATYTWQP